MTLSIYAFIVNCLNSTSAWIESNSDFVTAAATIAIAFFTFILYRATRKLWKVSQEQSRDMKESLRIAQESADAAKRSADALPAIERAYVFVKITMANPDAEGIAGTTYEESQYNADNAKVIITNHGKTPALITGLSFTTKVLSDVEIDKYISEIITDINNDIPSGTTIIDTTIQKSPIPAGFMMNKHLWETINMNTAFLTCLGCIHYDDVFGNPHKTVFCWKYEQFTGFHPDKDPKRNYRT